MCRMVAYLGEKIGTAEAERYGLINRAVPAAELDTVIQSVSAPCSLLSVMLRDRLVRPGGER